jgi:hypothetical protein
VGDYSDIPKNKSYTRIIERHIENKEGPDIDLDQIANKIAEKLIGTIGKNFEKNHTKNVKLDKESDDFDISKTMESLAKAMVVNRDEESNFKNLGETKINKAKDSVKNTIDLLSDLDD